MAENERLLTAVEVVAVENTAWETVELSGGPVVVRRALLAAQDAKTIRALERAGLLAHEGYTGHWYADGTPAPPEYRREHCPACKLLAEGGRDG